MVDAVWGSGGQLTSSSDRARRRLAEALLTQGTSTAPVQSWTQGLARVAQALVGGMYMRDEDQKDKEASDLLLSNPLLGGGGISQSISTAPAAVSTSSNEQTVPNDSNAVPGTVGMNQRLADRLSDYIDDNPGTYLSSGVRSTADQARLYADRANNPNPVAPPGTSLHERGLAADIGGMTPDQRAMLPQYGLSQPVANDPVHVQLAANDPAALPANSQPTQGFAIPGAQVQPGISQMHPAMQNYIRRLIANPQTRGAGISLLSQYAKPREMHSQVTDASGNIWDVNQMTGQRTVSLKADDAGRPITPAERAAYGLPDSLPVMMTSKGPKAIGGGSTTVNNNYDPNAGQSYDKILTEGIAKSHAGLANGVEDAQSRARDIAAMQGAIDAIQRNGGTTGGMGQQQVLELKKSINSGANALGMSNPFNENDISDKEFLTKFNRSMAGAQAKNAVGARVTNFELGNFLKANPGLDMSVTGNQRLLGIQAQIEQRNIAVGNAIRAATADAVSQGKRINPSQVESLIREYDDQHHITDPVTGQDLTQSYVLPEFQKEGMGSNPSLAVGHTLNLNGIKIRRVQ